jgi:hypothetical protein
MSRVEAIRMNIDCVELKLDDDSTLKFGGNGGTLCFDWIPFPYVNEAKANGLVQKTNDFKYDDNNVQPFTLPAKKDMWEITVSPFDGNGFIVHSLKPSHITVVEQENPFVAHVDNGHD